MQRVAAREYLLTAKGFTVPDDASGRHRLRDILADLLRDMEMQVFYDEAQGVRRMVIEHFGDRDGRIVLELTDVAFDEHLVSMTDRQLERPGLTLDPLALYRLQRWGRKKL